MFSKPWLFYAENQPIIVITCGVKVTLTFFHQNVSQRNFRKPRFKKTETGFLNLPKMDVVRTMTWHKIWRGISVLVLLVEKRNDLKWIPQNVHNFVKINTAYLNVPITVTVEQSALYAWEASKGPPTVTGVIFVKSGNKARYFWPKASKYYEYHLEQL